MYCTILSYRYLDVHREEVGDVALGRLARSPQPLSAFFLFWFSHIVPCWEHRCRRRQSDDPLTILRQPWRQESALVLLTCSACSSVVGHPAHDTAPRVEQRFCGLPEGGLHLFAGQHVRLDDMELGDFEHSHFVKVSAIPSTGVGNISRTPYISLYPVE